MKDQGQSTEKKDQTRPLNTDQGRLALSPSLAQIERSLDLAPSFSGTYPGGSLGSWSLERSWQAVPGQQEGCVTQASSTRVSHQGLLQPQGPLPVSECRSIPSFHGASGKDGSHVTVMKLRPGGVEKTRQGKSDTGLRVACPLPHF